MEKAKAIKTLIAQDRIEEALEMLADVYRESSFMREIILQKRRHQALMNENNQGIVSYGETALEKNKIAKAVLDLIDDIEQAEKAGPARRWWKLQAGRYRLLLLTIALLAVVAGGFVFYQHIEQQNNQEHIQWLDEEIAARIKRIDIPSWYRIALVKDSAIDLQKRLLLQPGDEMAIQERFKDRNLRSLLQELRDRVESLEREILNWRWKNCMRSR